MDIAKAREELKFGKTIFDMNLNVAYYGRVSTDKNDQLNSLENQKKYFSDMISSVKSWNCVCGYNDYGISGTQVYKREKFLKMIEDARCGKIDLILTKEVSRFARNTVDSISYTELLLKYGVVVYFISDNINTIYPDSEFRLTLMASMAQDEVRKLSERVKFGIKRSIKDGKVGGGGIYGYDKKDCKLSVNNEESKVVKIIYELYASEKYGLRKIGEILASRGYYTRKGNVFSDTTLKKMIKNPRYKGWYTANMSEVKDYKTHKKVMKPKEEWIIYKDDKGNVPSIVDEKLWNKANSLLCKRCNKWNKNVLNKEIYIENKKYTSKIYCIEHNKTFIRCASGKRKSNPVWQCNEYLRHGLKGCITPRLYEKKLDYFFSEILENEIEHKIKLIDLISNDYINLINEYDDVNDIKNKIKEQEKYKDKLFDMVLKNIITYDEFNEKNINIKNEILNLKNKLSIDCKKEYNENLLKKIKSVLHEKLDIKNNIGMYFNLFIDKVFVSKINNDRKYVNFEIIFNYKRENLKLNFNMD